MEVEVGVLYSLWPDPSHNLLSLRHPVRRPLLLAHLLPLLQRRHCDKVLVELVSERGCRRLHSPACELPVEHGVVRLRLLPAGAPPFAPAEQALELYERSVLGSSGRERYSDRPRPGEHPTAAQTAVPAERSRPPPRPSAGAGLER